MYQLTHILAPLKALAKLDNSKDKTNASFGSYLMTLKLRCVTLDTSILIMGAVGFVPAAMATLCDTLLRSPAMNIIQHDLK